MHLGVSDPDLFPCQSTRGDLPRVEKYPVFAAHVKVLSLTGSASERGRVPPPEHRPRTKSSMTTSYSSVGRFFRGSHTDHGSDLSGAGEAALSRYLIEKVSVNMCQYKMLEDAYKKKHRDEAMLNS